MSEQLEQRYRALLRLLPKHYREARGEELLGTLMEGSDERRRWPEAREAVSMAGLSLRTRFTAGGEHRPMRGLPRLGEAARAVALLGAALLAFDGVDALNQVYAQLHTLLPRSSSGHLTVSWAIRAELPALWLVVYLLLVFGRWVPARVLAVGLFLAAAVGRNSEFGVVTAHLLPVAVVAGATMVARGADARRVGGSGYRLAAGVTAVTMGAVGGLAAAGRDYPQHYRWVWDLSRVLLLTPSTQPGSVFFYAATIAVLGVVAALALRSPVWPLAAALVGAALMLPWAGFLAQHEGLTGQGLHRALAVEGALVLLAALAVYKQRRTVRTATPLPTD